MADRIGLPIYVDPDDAPEWLAGARSGCVMPTPKVTAQALRIRDLERWLAHQGLPRPTLWQLEAERARRRREGITEYDEPAHRPQRQRQRRYAAA